MSAILKLTMRTEPPCHNRGRSPSFSRVVRASFAQRRKTLLNGLSSGFSNLSKEQLSAVIEDCGLPANVRGETLEIEGFAAIANEIYKLLH